MTTAHLTDEIAEALRECDSLREAAALVGLNTSTIRRRAEVDPELAPLLRACAERGRAWRTRRAWTARPMLADALKRARSVRAAAALLGVSEGTVRRRALGDVELAPLLRSCVARGNALRGRRTSTFLHEPATCKAKGTNP